MEYWRGVTELLFTPEPPAAELFTPEPPTAEVFTTVGARGAAATARV